MKPMMAANWKMNKTAKEAADFIKALKRKVKGVKGVDILICPPFTALQAASKEAKDSIISIGAQDLFWEKEGAYTGQISSKMLKEFCSYVIIGHSERRKYFAETDETVNKKISSALSAGLKVILCVGETAEERASGRAKEVVERQLRRGLEGIQAGKMIIAYEPVWAISSGDPNHKSATPADAQEMHSFIRQKLSQIYSIEHAKKTRLLYGGSMKPENVKELMRQPDIDGGLVGGASLDTGSFLKLIGFKG